MYFGLNSIFFYFCWINVYTYALLPYIPYLKSKYYSTQPYHKNMQILHDNINPYGENNVNKNITKFMIFAASQNKTGVIQDVKDIKDIKDVEGNSYGRPREAYRNISYNSIDDIEPEDLFEKFQKLLNQSEGYQKRKYVNRIHHEIRKQHRLSKLKKNEPHIRKYHFNETEELEEMKKDEEIAEKLKEDLERNLGIRVFLRKNDEQGTNIFNYPQQRTQNQHKQQNQQHKDASENFKVMRNPPYNFSQVGGYENVKAEMMQSVDMLKHYEKYQKYNVRVPKGLILEGPPGNGKTLLARAFSGEVNSSFIAVSGSQFQEKYVGVGASRIRELFELARDNTPCVIFIDEIDALGRSRSSKGEDSNTERDQTLNELLISLDGYQNSSGIFVVGATNRIDLLDSALTRPGRIDKKIYIGNPDAKTRESILNIHLHGKPRTNKVHLSTLIDITNGLSGAQIENLLNEAMLYALRNNREKVDLDDIELMLGRILVGYQPIENAFSEEMIHRISVHEMGHAIVGLMSPHHVKLVKVCLNLWSPTSPGYTIFEHPEIDSSIYTRERLTERLMVLLGGRIAEEVFFGNSITSGASHDISQAYALAEQMIVKYGMGRKTVYAHSSENSREFIDRDIERLLESAYQSAHNVITHSKSIIEQCAPILSKNKILLPCEINAIIHKEHLKQAEAMNINDMNDINNMNQNNTYISYIQNEDETNLS